MFRVQKVVEAVKIDSFASFVPVAIEQFPSKEFFNNAAGWCKNDLAALVAATTKQEYDMLVQRLKVNDPQFNVKDDTKVSDAIMSIKPRWCQSPNEIVSYVDSLTRANLEAAYDAALKDVDLQGNKDVQDDVSVDAKTE